MNLRTYILTERMHLVLLGVVNDAVLDAPEDEDLRKLQTIVRSAKITEPEPAEGS